jgi:nitrite reductase/ring-hydroxylating ferredoxin subunit
MMSATPPDLSSGVAIEDLPDGGMIQGKVGSEDVIVARSGGEYFAIAASCPHYGGPLVRGLIVGEEIRCPLHHACFSMRTGEVLRPPAFDAIDCWRIEQLNGRVYVREKLAPRTPVRRLEAPRETPSAILIVGGGAAGFSAADTLRHEGYEGPLTLVTADDAAPYDRPNLSKEYLAGKAPDEWLPLRPAQYYADTHIDLVLNAKAASIDIARQEVQLTSSASTDWPLLRVRSRFGSPFQGPQSSSSCTFVPMPTRARSLRVPHPRSRCSCSVVVSSAWRLRLLCGSATLACTSLREERSRSSALLARSLENSCVGCMRSMVLCSIWRMR